MGQTRFFGLSFFDFGDRLDSSINVQKEIDRFVVVDKQLYGLYKIFGNGVISGWDITIGAYSSDNGINISVSEGIGIINYMAAQTDLPSYVYNLPPNSISDIYAIVVGETVFDRTVSFISSTLPISSEGKIRIARVATGDNSVLYFDQNVRDLIGFEEIINNRINEHRHRGTPSKIDLKEETKNQLPGARISGIDASKVNSGVLDVARLPIIDHSQLEHNGLLTHEALDSFVKTLSQSNKELLGEINSSNLIKMTLFLKQIYPDVDEHFVNHLSIVPGISSNNYIDFDFSTANISLDSGCISGKPVSVGMYTSVYWNDDNSFFNNRFISKNYDQTYGDMIVKNDTVSLRRSSEAIQSIINFDNLISLQNVFSVDLLIVDNNQNASVVNKGDGNITAQLGGGAKLVYYYRKNFSSSERLNLDGNYDKIVLKVKTDEHIHKPVYMYIVNGSNLSNDPYKTYGSIEEGDIEGIKIPSNEWTILAEDEHMSEFKEIIIPISGLGLNDVSQITFYTEDDFTFYLDDIYAIRTDIVVPSGSINFRYNTQSNVIFHSVFYDADVYPDTVVKVRVKTASSLDGLSRSSWSMPINSGSVLALSGSAAEIEVYMESDSDQINTPFLNSLELRMMVSSNVSGFVIDTEQDWERGDFYNVSMTDSTEEGKSILSILPPINVNGKYFSSSNSISEINEDNQSVLGVNGSFMPISPSQAKLWASSPNRGFDVVPSIFRKYDKNFIIADLYNNRVMEVDSNGSLVRGFGSSYTTDSNFYPVSVIYNPENYILSIVFTKKATVKNIAGIRLYHNLSLIRLTEKDEVINSKKSDGKIVEIQLNRDTYSRLVGINSDLSINFDSGSFAETIIFPSSVNNSSNNIYNSIGGMVCSVGNFTYIDNIKHPVFVREVQNGNWIIANSSIYYDSKSNEDEEVDVPSVIEINPDDINDTSDKLINNEIKFSDFTLGSIFEYEDGKFIIAGLQSGTNNLGVASGSEFLQNYDEDSITDNLEFRSKAIDSLKDYVGRIFVVDRISNNLSIFYNSPDGLFPSSISRFSNGDFLCSESSFYESSGRLIRLDTFGNIKWNYGSGTFNVINRSDVLDDDKIIVSV